MNYFVRRVAGTVLAAGLAVSSINCFAINGYFVVGSGTKNIGMVGAGVALPQDALAAATNPAGMVFVGERLDIGSTLFSSATSSYSASAAVGGCGGTGCAFTFGDGSGTTAQTLQSQDEFFLIPYIGANWMLNPDSAFGLTLYPNGGGKTRFKGGSANHDDGTGVATTTTAGTFGAGDAGLELQQLFLASTYSRKLTANSSWGISLIAAAQRFKLQGLSLFSSLSVDPANFTDNGFDTSAGIGAKLGVQGDVGGGVTLAASYQPRIKMSKFSNYAGLLANGGELDIPATWTAGLAWKLVPRQVLVFDVQGIQYADVPAVGNSGDVLLTNCTPGVSGGTGTGCYGGTYGIGHGWRNMTIAKLGYQWQFTQQWTYRMGYSHGNQIIPSSQVAYNVISGAVTQDHVSLGLTYAPSPNREWDFAFLKAMKNKVTGTSAFNAGQQISLTSELYGIELSYAIKY